MADYKPSGVPPTGNLSDDLMVVNRPLGDVYVIRLVNAEPSLTPVCTGNVIVNATCTTCRSDANLVPAIKTDSGSQTAKAVRGGSALATNAAVIAEAAAAYPIAESARHTVATAAMAAAAEVVVEAVEVTVAEATAAKATGAKVAASGNTAFAATERVSRVKISKLKYTE